MFMRGKEERRLPLHGTPSIRPVLLDDGNGWLPPARQVDIEAHKPVPEGMGNPARLAAAIQIKADRRGFEDLPMQAGGLLTSG